jgi:hypothetical protein
VCVCLHTRSLTHTAYGVAHSPCARTLTHGVRERGEREGSKRGGQRERERGSKRMYTRRWALCKRNGMNIYHTHTHTHTHAKVGAVQVLRNGKVGWGVPKAGDSQVIVDDTQYRTSIHNTAIPYFDTQYRNSVLRYTIPRAHRRMHKPTYVHTHKI